MRQPVATEGFWPGQQGYAIIPWWNPLHWNWRRGLVRLWLLASLMWAGYWLYNLQLACAFWFAPWCEAPAHVDWPNGSMLLGLAMVLLSGPLPCWRRGGSPAGRSAACWRGAPARLGSKPTKVVPCCVCFRPASRRR
jgi:hypothetical protein